jgi:hypothetical protein
MPQPIENVRRALTPETFCSPARRGRSVAETSTMVAPTERDCCANGGCACNRAQPYVRFSGEETVR